jgi:hypothetical protein
MIPTYSYDKPLIIQPHHSIWLQLIIISSHGLTLLFVILVLHQDRFDGVLVLDNTYSIPLLFSILILASFVYYYKLHVLKSSSSSIQLATHSFGITQYNKDWSIRLAHHKKDIEVKLLPTSFVSTWIIILNFKDLNYQQYSLLIFHDGIDKNIYRQLKVRLKLLKLTTK